MKVYEALHWASSFLGENQRDDNIGELYLMHLLDVDKTQLLMRLHDELSPKIYETLEAGVIQHVETGIPVQHLIGHEEFYGRKFKVTSDTLIPRPETEELIVNTLQRIKSMFGRVDALTLADVGTGTSAIASTMKLELAEMNVIATDISESALVVAIENASSLGADVDFQQGDLLWPLIESGIKVDVLLSNPPYIPETDKVMMKDTVLNFDPSLALFADEQGLKCYRLIIENADKILSDKALIGFEIGDGQGAAIRDLLAKQFDSARIEVLRDINGKERMVFCSIGI